MLFKNYKEGNMLSLCKIATKIMMWHFVSEVASFCIGGVSVLVEFLNKIL